MWLLPPYQARILIREKNDLRVCRSGFRRCALLGIWYGTMLGPWSISCSAPLSQTWSVGSSGAEGSHCDLALALSGGVCMAVRTPGSRSRRALAGSHTSLQGETKDIRCRHYVWSFCSAQASAAWGRAALQIDALGWTRSEDMFGNQEHADVRYDYESVNIHDKQ